MVCGVEQEGGVEDECDAQVQRVLVCVYTLSV